MPKLKTHKGARSRFHVTGGGKLMRTKCGKSHFRRKKAPRTKRLYDEMIPVSSADKKRIGRLLPHA
ncbi:MAG: 50S ribosomal protein L35 [Dehalococcoidia bacterium]|nr:MAG: 50S ribosomal protein L35 [Dehalococcoidia bacterium]